MNKIYTILLCLVLSGCATGMSSAKKDQLKFKVDPELLVPPKDLQKL